MSLISFAVFFDDNVEKFTRVPSSPEYLLVRSIDTLTTLNIKKLIWTLHTAPVGQIKPV